jgi:hypothetical protein
MRPQRHDFAGAPVRGNTSFLAVGEAGWYFLGLRDASAVRIPCGCGAAMSECSLWGKVSVDREARMLARELIRGRSIHPRIVGAALRRIPACSAFWQPPAGSITLWRNGRAPP